MSRYLDRVFRLADKIKKSQTPVPGLMVGLSGTDSVVAFLMAYDAMAIHGKADRVCGVHYVAPNRRTPSWFDTDVMPWLRERCPEATLIVDSPLGGNQDQQRWADLHLRALNHMAVNGEAMTARQQSETYWVMGTINATEKALGKYSIMATAVSVQPLITLYKSQIIQICLDLGVPEIAVRYSRLPDCLCGRDELAAENIETIDDIITSRLDPTRHDTELLAKLFRYVRENLEDNGFKQRIPYVI